MSSERADFQAMPLDAERVVINLEMAHTQWVDAKRMQQSKTAGLGSRMDAINTLIAQRCALYKALRLPVVGDKFAVQLRALDVAEKLGTEVLVSGATAFTAYELLCAYRFPLVRPVDEVLLLSWKASDSPEQPQLPNNDWLHRGQSFAVVVSTPRYRACPLAVPDPRWMALHSIWAASTAIPGTPHRSQRLAAGRVLLDACDRFLSNLYPLNPGFVDDLPVEAQSVLLEFGERS